MANIFAYSDSPEAATGFGRSAHHVLHALHDAGHRIVQLAVNHDIGREKHIPWRVFAPSRRNDDPYGLWDLPMILRNEGPFDVFWTTFDPEVPWAYRLPGVEPKMTAMDFLLAQKRMQPGFKMAGWFPVDGGPLSNYEMGILTDRNGFDLRVTMASHVLDLIKWTQKLRGNDIDMAKLAEILKVAPHGVDMSLYRIASDEERADAKEQLGFPRDTFLIVQVERNQQRKQVWRAIEGLEKLRQMLPKESIHLYQHMHPDESNQHAGAGWNLPELTWRYGMKPNVDVRWRNRHYPEKEMVDIVYAAADVFLSTSAGEGFQYPAWEALACGRRVVLPNDSARKAWLSSTPGAYLYKSDPHAEVMRGSYNRRMSRPDIFDACRTIKKMVEGKQKHAETSEASRAWVEKTASVGTVKDWWVKSMEELAASVVQERTEKGYTVYGEPKTDHVIALRQPPGLGDFIMMLPAIAAYVAMHPGDTSCLAIPRSDNHLELTRFFNPCDMMQIDERIPLKDLGESVRDLVGLWHPKHTWNWSDPATHRTDAVAEFLGVPLDRLQKLPAIPVEAPIKAAKAHFVQRYGTHPSNCVAICPQSHNPARSLPEAYTLAVAEQIINLGLTPVLVGSQRIECARVGILNLAGHTDFGGLIGLLGSVKAAVCIDSAPLHIAAIQGTPLVALMPLFSGESRLKYYSGEIVTVEPECTELAGEIYPPGKDGSTAWVSELAPPRIMAALKQLLQIDEPEDDTPQVLTAADLGEEA